MADEAVEIAAAVIEEDYKKAIEKLRTVVKAHPDIGKNLYEGLQARLHGRRTSSVSATVERASKMGVGWAISGVGGFFAIPTGGASLLPMAAGIVLSTVAGMESDYRSAVSRILNALMYGKLKWKDRSIGNLEDRLTSNQEINTNSCAVQMTIVNVLAGKEVE